MDGSRETNAASLSPLKAWTAPAKPPRCTGWRPACAPGPHRARNRRARRPADRHEDPPHPAGFGQPGAEPATELLLYFASRAQNVDEWILPALERGEIVLSDRFTDSSLVYQGCGRGLGADAVIDLDRIACRGLKPDLTILVDVDAEASLARARARNIAEPHPRDPHGRPVARLPPQGLRRLSRARRRASRTASSW